MYPYVYNLLLLSFFVIGIIILIKGKELHKPEKQFMVAIIIFFILYFAYFFFFTFSTFYILPEPIALGLWNLSIIIKIFSNLSWVSIFVLELHKNSKIRYLPILFFLLIAGIIISLFFIPNSFLVNRSDQDYFYSFSNLGLLTTVNIINILMIIVLNSAHLIGFSNYRDRSLSRLYSVYIFMFSVNVILYLLYLATQINVIKHFHLVLYLLNTTYMIFVILKRPSLFVIFTNKLYNFIVFHKSGILLFSYDFETNQELEESLLKGSILIGINHILSNFLNVENQITIIKLEDHGILFHFNKELGYATLLIAKHKNSLLENTLKSFNEKFSERHRDTLLNLKGLIDVSEFSQTLNLVKEEFKPYLY